MRPPIQLTNIEGIEDQLKGLLDIEYALDKSAIVGATDRQGNIIFVNDLFCELSQFTREELIGQNHRIH